DRAPSPSAGVGGVAGEDPLVGADDRQPRMGRRLVLGLEQALRPRRPPRTGAMRAVSKRRCIATRTAAPAAARWSPACMQAAWARSHVSIVTSRWPAA